MELSEINPFIRFAQLVNYKSKGNWVTVRDCRIFYILSGSADLFIENQHYALKPNSVFYCSAGQVYKIRTDSVSILSLNFDLDQTRKTMTDYYSPIALEIAMQPAAKLLTVHDCAYINSHLYIPDGLEYMGKIKEIINEFSMQIILYREKCSGILKDILCDFHRKSILSSRHSATAVDTALSFIKANFNQEITNSMLANLIGYHEYHLNRLFKKHTGLSIYKYVLNTRISESKKLLLNSNLSITAIAEMVGFKNVQHFSAYFKQSTGVSPYTYRQKFKL